MNDQILNTIRENVRKNSDAIKHLKDTSHDEKYPHIHPKHKNWEEYKGRKHEVTKWLIMLHQHKGTQEKIRSHLYKEEKGQPLHKTIIKEAIDCLNNLVEKETLQTIAASPAKIEPTPVRFVSHYRVTGS